MVFRYKVAMLLLQVQNGASNITERNQTILTFGDGHYVSDISCWRWQW